MRQPTYFRIFRIDPTRGRRHTGTTKTIDEAIYSATRRAAYTGMRYEVAEGTWDGAPVVFSADPATREG